MGSSSIAKYVIYATIEVDGVVEKPDVIGALFGQTEGLLGPELDLRELLRTGRIGRIQVELDSKGGKTRGIVSIPSNIDRSEVALIAAAIEAVDKVGPHSARVTLQRIEDLREEKRRRIAERAKEILRKMMLEEEPRLHELVEEVSKILKTSEVSSYGPEGLAAGPDVAKADTLIVVEGRADVINLLRYGYRNVIATGGAKVPQSIINLSKDKSIIAFIDGDHSGDLILKELMQMIDIDYVARAPPGREVEDLTGKEVDRCLGEKMPASKYRALIGVLEPKREVAKPPIFPPQIMESMKLLRGSLEGLILDDKWNVIQKVAVKDLIDILQGLDKVHAVIFDGIITQRLVETAEKRRIPYLIGARIGAISKRPSEVSLLVFDDVLEAAP